MTTLAAQLIANSHAEKRQAWDDYRDIVRRADTAEDGDAVRIVEVCRLLDIPVKDIALDAQAYRHLPSVISRAALAEPLGKDMDKLTLKLKKLKDTLAEYTKTKTAQINSLVQDAAKVSYEFGVAMEARKKIESLQARHWRIFNRASPMPPSDGVGKAAGHIHPKALQALLDTEPGRILYGHTGDGTVITALEVDYTRVEGSPGEWARTDLNGEVK